MLVKNAYIFTILFYLLQKPESEMNILVNMPNKEQRTKIVFPSQIKYYFH